MKQAAHNARRDLMLRSKIFPLALAVGIAFAGTGAAFAGNGDGEISPQKEIDAALGAKTSMSQAIAPAAPANRGRDPPSTSRNPHWRYRMIQIENGEIRTLFNKVPEVTIYFWIIKVMATTVGETAADLLSVRLNLGLTVTSYVMSAVF